MPPEALNRRIQRREVWLPARHADSGGVSLLVDADKHNMAGSIGFIALDTADTNGRPETAFPMWLEREARNGVSPAMQMAKAEVGDAKALSGQLMKR